MITAEGLVDKIVKNLEKLIIRDMREAVKFGRAKTAIERCQALAYAGNVTSAMNIAFLFPRRTFRIAERKI